MNKTINLLFAGAMATLMMSCVKDDLYDTPHPTQGALVVTTTWDGRSSNADIPANYMIRIGSTQHEVSGLTNTYGDLLAPGEHTMLVYNRPAGISIAGDIATVDAASRDGGRIEATPGFLFGHAMPVNIVADDTVRVTSPMTQYVRTLRIELSITDGDHTRVTRTTGTLEGVESGVNLLTGTRMAQPATVVNDYTISDNDKKMTVTYNLMGIVHSATKTLTTHIEFSNGDTQTVVSDLTDQLTDFHGDVAPLTLSASLSLPKQPGFSATIDNWQAVDGGNVYAH